MDITPIITTLISTVGTIVVAYLTIKKPKKPNIKVPSQWKKVATIGLIVLLAINAVLLGIVLATYLAPVEVAMTYPSAGSHVGVTEIVRGTSQNIPDGKAIWILVFIPQLDRYYPMLNTPLVQSNGDWSCFTTIGGPNDNGTFSIVLVLADKTAQDALNNYNKDSAENSLYPGILTKDLPAGLTTYQRVNVTRTPIRTLTPTVAINLPTNGSTANHSATVMGTSQNIPNGKAIWLLVYVPKVHLYYPMPAPAAVNSAGDWYSFATLGGSSDIGDEFDIIAVVADQPAQNTIIDYNISLMKRELFRRNCVTSNGSGRVLYGTGNSRFRGEDNFLSFLHTGIRICNGIGS